MPAGNMRLRVIRCSPLISPHINQSMLTSWLLVIGFIPHFHLELPSTSGSNPAGFQSTGAEQRQAQYHRWLAFMS